MGAALDSRKEGSILVARRDNRPDAKDSWQLGQHLAEGAEVSEEEMWQNYRYFLRAVLPIAEEGGRHARATS